MRLQHFVIGALVVMAVIAGSFSYFNNLGSSFGVVANDTVFQPVVDENQNVATKINDSWDKVQGSATNANAQFFTGVLAMFSVAKTIITAPMTMMVSLIVVMSDVLVLPEWAVTLMGGVLVTLIVFAVVSLIFRFKA